MKRLILGVVYVPPNHNRTLTDAFHNRVAAAAELCAVITNWRRQEGDDLSESDNVNLTHPD